MIMLPLAVYTADHGLAWTYPKEEIDFAELDACRKALGGLPDFDAGESGYEGVWVTEKRVFAMRCQSVDAWDFRGRSATYLAVTWMSRKEAEQIDFEDLLNASALTVPSHNPAAFFKMNGCVHAIGGGLSEGRPSALHDGFRRVAQVLKGLSPATSATFKRILGERMVSCYYRENKNMRNMPFEPRPMNRIGDQTLLRSSTLQRGEYKSAQKCENVQVKLLACVTLALAVCTFLLASITLWRVFELKKQVESLNKSSEKVEQAKGVDADEPSKSPKADTPTEDSCVSNGQEDQSKDTQQGEASVDASSTKQPPVTSDKKKDIIKDVLKRIIVTGKQNSEQ